MKAIPQAVSVKNAVLMEDNGTYTLQHYDTIILVVKNGEITTLENHISLSSTRAINQALSYLGLSGVKGGNYR